VAHSGWGPFEIQCLIEVVELLNSKYGAWVIIRGRVCGTLPLSILNALQSFEGAQCFPLGYKESEEWRPLDSWSQIIPEW